MSIGAGPQPSNFPYGFNNGAFVRGVAVQPTTPGQVFWVYNGAALAPQGAAGSDGNGGSFQRPYATIQKAVSACVAGRGDVVYVKPGHAETLSSATTLALNVAGVTVIGLGAGASRPTLSFSTSTAATIAVTAAGCALINFNIDATGFASLVAAVTPTAADFTLQGCTIKLAGTNNALHGVASNASATGMVIDSNIFLASAGAGTTDAILMVGGAGIVITNNVIEGQFTAGTGGISNITTAATDLFIQANLINNQTAASTKAITCVAGTTGMISGNRIQILSGTAPITAAGMSWAGGNFYANALGASLGTSGII